MIEKRDDHTLVQLLQKGNVEAFDSLFEAYSPKLYGFAFKYFKNETDAEELVQAVFVKIWENRQSIKSEYSFKSYLFTIALNQIRKYFNKKAIYHRYMERIQHDPMLTDIQETPAEDYEATFDRINYIINQMPPRRQEIFKRSKLEGKSSKEVAAELNISPGTVDNQVSEALLFIRSKMNIETHSLLLFAFLFIY